MLNLEDFSKNMIKLRKESGFTQERLAELLDISAPAISKWENGHSLPDILLLPRLSKLFNCTVDHILLNDTEFIVNQFDEDFRKEQAKQIADYILESMEMKNNIGLDNNSIIKSFYSKHGHVGSCSVKRMNLCRTDRNICQRIILSVHNREYRLYEKILFDGKMELRNAKLLYELGIPVPKMYCLDYERNVILMEDISEDYIGGTEYDEPTENGKLYKDNYKNLITGIADFHLCGWENEKFIKQVDTDWRLRSIDNLLQHIDGMERTYRKFIERNKDKVTIDISKAYEEALNYLREYYPKAWRNRFFSGKGITVIHGDMHPGNVYMSLEDCRIVKFLDYEAVRVGLGTEDLAMFLALHTAEEDETLQNCMNIYYNRIQNTIKEYTKEEFEQDFKLSIAESLFFPMKLYYDHGILDKGMIEKGIRAFQAICNKVQ